MPLIILNETQRSGSVSLNRQFQKQKKLKTDDFSLKKSGDYCIFGHTHNPTDRSSIET